MFEIKTRYYHHPESSCVWYIENCTQEEHDECFGDFLTCEIDWDTFVLLEEQYAEV